MEELSVCRWFDEGVPCCIGDESVDNVVEVETSAEFIVMISILEEAGDALMGYGYGKKLSICDSSICNIDSIGEPKTYQGMVAFYPFTILLSVTIKNSKLR